MSENDVEYNYVYQPMGMDHPNYSKPDKPIYAVAGPDVDRFGLQDKFYGLPKSNCYLQARKLNEVHGRLNKESDYFKKEYLKFFPQVLTT